MTKSHIPWILTILVSVLFWIQTCRHNKEIDKKNDLITQLDLDKQSLTTTVNRNNQTIHSQEAIIVQYTSSLNSLTDTIFDLKKKDARNRETIAYFKEHTVTQLDTVTLAFIDTVTITNPAECPPDSFLAIPRTIDTQTPNYTFNGIVSHNGLTINTLAIPDTLQLRFMEHKRFLGSPKIEVQFFHSNPLITTTQANSVIYHPPHKKRLLEKALLIGAGVFLGTKL